MNDTLSAILSDPDYERRQMLDEVADAFLRSEPPVRYIPPRRVAADGYVCPEDPFEDLPEAPKPREKKMPRVTSLMSGANWHILACAESYQKQLCGPLWFENEICIMFADTNVGKSILAVQIAEMISRGQPTPAEAGALPLPQLLPQTPAQPVVYADFELSRAQFSRRYSWAPEGDEEYVTKRTYHHFEDHFYRAELNLEADECDMREIASGHFADIVIADLEQRVVETRAKVLIIDNITFMASGTETAADAMPLMKKLTSLKKKHGLSILLLAHTPKRNRENPLTRNDLQGSKMLINFTDSAFAVGESAKGGNIRYIKQIKQRNCEQIYGDDNVIECVIERVEPTFIGFRSTGTGPEREHLERQPATGGKRASKEKLRSQAAELRQAGRDIRAIADELEISTPYVYRLLSKAQQP